MFSVLHCFASVDIKLISVLVLVLMTTSIECQSKESLCKFIAKEGKVRDLGLYQFIDTNRHGLVIDSLVENTMTFPDSEVEMQRNTSYCSILRIGKCRPIPILLVITSVATSFMVDYAHQKRKLKLILTSTVVQNKWYVYCDEWLFYANVV